MAQHPARRSGPGPDPAKGRAHPFLGSREPKNHRGKCRYAPPAPEPTPPAVTWICRCGRVSAPRPSLARRMNTARPRMSSARRLTCPGPAGPRSGKPISRPISRPAASPVRLGLRDRNNPPAGAPSAVPGPPGNKNRSGPLTHRVSFNRRRPSRVAAPPPLPGAAERQPRAAGSAPTIAMLRRYQKDPDTRCPAR